MLNYIETIDSFTVTSTSQEVSVGSFVQLRVRPKKGGNVRIMNNGVEYSIQAGQLSPKMDGSVVVYRDSPETEIYIERHTYRLQSTIDNDEGLVQYKSNPVTGGVKVSAGDVDLKNVFSSQVSSGYYCHLFAGECSNGDVLVPDISGAQSHAAFGAGMTKTIAWANAGLATTGTALASQNFVMPTFNWDYLNGESLILTWKGRGTAPASTKGLVANSAGSSNPGIALRAQADGRLQTYLSNGAGVFLQPSVLVSFEPTVTHAFSLVIDGLNRKYSLVEDGNESRSMALIASGNNIDTRTTNALLLGTQDNTGVASNAVASQTQALVILRGRIGKGLPTNWLELTKSIQRNPGRLVTADQW